jgi:hypothetical protein
LTAGTKIVLVVEAVAEKQQLPEAPISITVLAYYAGFQVLITRRTGEQSKISQVPGIVSLVNKLVEAGFEPVREGQQLALPIRKRKRREKNPQVPSARFTMCLWCVGKGSKKIRNMLPFGLAHRKTPTARFANIAPGSRHHIIRKLIFQDWHTHLRSSRVFNASHSLTLRP